MKEQCNSCNLKIGGYCIICFVKPSTLIIDCPCEICLVKIICNSPCRERQLFFERFKDLNSDNKIALDSAISRRNTYRRTFGGPH